MAERPPFSGSLARLEGTRRHRAAVEAILEGIAEEEAAAVERLHGELAPHLGRIMTVVGTPVRLWGIYERGGREEFLTPSLSNGAAAHVGPGRFEHHLFARLEPYADDDAIWLATPDRLQYRTGIIVPLAGIVSIELEPQLEEPDHS